MIYVLRKETNNMENLSAFVLLSAITPTSSGKKSKPASIHKASKLTLKRRSLDYENILLTGNMQNNCEASEKHLDVIDISDDGSNEPHVVIISSDDSMSQDKLTMYNSTLNISNDFKLFLSNDSEVSAQVDVFDSSTSSEFENIHKHVTNIVASLNNSRENQSFSTNDIIVPETQERELDKSYKSIIIAESSLDETSIKASINSEFIAENKDTSGNPVNISESSIDTSEIKEHCSDDDSVKYADPVCEETSSNSYQLEFNNNPCKTGKDNSQDSAHEGNALIPNIFNSLLEENFSQTESELVRLMVDSSQSANENINASIPGNTEQCTILTLDQSNINDDPGVSRLITSDDSAANVTDDVDSSFATKPAAPKDIKLGMVDDKQDYSQEICTNIQSLTLNDGPPIQCMESASTSVITIDNSLDVTSSYGSQSGCPLNSPENPNCSLLACASFRTETVNDSDFTAEIKANSSSLVRTDVTKRMNQVSKTPANKVKNIQQEGEKRYSEFVSPGQQSPPLDNPCTPLNKSAERLLDELYGHSWRSSGQMLIKTESKPRHKTKFTSKIPQTERKPTKRDDSRMFTNFAKEIRADCESTRSVPSARVNHYRGRSSFITSDDSDVDNNTSTFYNAVNNTPLQKPAGLRQAIFTASMRKALANPLLEKCKTLCDSDSESESEPNRLSPAGELINSCSHGMENMSLSDASGSKNSYAKTTTVTTPAPVQRRKLFCQEDFCREKSHIVDEIDEIPRMSYSYVEDNRRKNSKEDLDYDKVIKKQPRKSKKKLLQNLLPPEPIKKTIQKQPLGRNTSSSDQLTPKLRKQRKPRTKTARNPLESKPISCNAKLTTPDTRPTEIVLDTSISDEDVVTRKYVRKPQIECISSSDSDEDTPIQKPSRKLRKPVKRNPVHEPKNSASDSDDITYLENFADSTKENTRPYPKGFIGSLSDFVPVNHCHPDALIYKTNFAKKREDLAKHLFAMYNSLVFQGKIPEDTPVEWNNRMRGTAGFCYNKRITKSTGESKRYCRIVLSTKVLDNPGRLRDTLIHEMCHAATWLIDGISDGHGSIWKSWAARAMKAFPELPPIKRCHDYEITTKYTYKCVNCGYCIGRHSKSLDTKRIVCGHCRGTFELLINKMSKNGLKSVQPAAKSQPTGFALYVKENYKTVKQTENLPHADIMRKLGQMFSLVKAGTPKHD